MTSDDRDVRPNAPSPDGGAISGRVVAARSHELDALSAILPPDRRDRMADVLTDADVATLKHLAQQGMGRNTLRALASDLHYLEVWAVAATNTCLPWPAPEALVFKFVAHHLFDPDERARNAAHGMPAPVARVLKAAGCLRTEGPHAPSTVRRRLSLWSTLHRFRGCEGPFAAPHLRNALRLAARAANRPRQRKSAKAVTRAVLDILLATCTGESLRDARDQAILLVGFASGGRRRSEIAALKVRDIVVRDPIPDPHGPLPCLALRLGRTKTSSADEDRRVMVVGRPALALRQWLVLAGITEGAVFRSIDRFGRLGTTALDGQSVNAILKARCLEAGLDPELFSAHGLRSGYLTEAARRGVPLQAAMQQSGHTSVQTAAGYYNEADVERSLAARLG